MRRANRPAPPAPADPDDNNAPVRVRQLRRRRRVPKPYENLRSSFLFSRSVVAGLLLRHHGSVLSATEGCFHGPFQSQCVGLVLYLTGTLLYLAFAKQNKASCDTVAVLLAIANLYFTIGQYPVYAVVCTALAGSGFSTRRFSYRFLAFIGALLVNLSSTTSFHENKWMAKISILLNFDSFTPLGMASMMLSLSLALCALNHRRLSYSVVSAGVFVGALSLFPKTIAYPEVPAPYRLLEQRMGVTGRISVLDDTQRNVRFLLSDHSILGGKYTSDEHAQETIFSQFHVHEAVRLSKGSDPKGRTLCIGLGMGVVAQAMHNHGCAVDAVELDFYVAQFAKRYFGVSGPSIAVGDGAKYLEKQIQNNGKKDGKLYDYIIHDCFTGGAIPAKMFNIRTLRNMKKVLKANGIVAVNFVGELTNPATAIAVSTIKYRLDSIWKHTAMYGEETRNNSKSGNTVVNVVLFATDVREKLTFREPTADDALGSTIRMHALETFQEHKIEDTDLPRITSQKEGARDSNLNKGQWITAKSHWNAMRTIIPKEVWFALARQKDRGGL